MIKVLVGYENRKAKEKEMSFVVIVEPDEFSRKNLKDLLDSVKPDFEYTILQNPDAAVDFLEKGSVDVLVSEMDIPVISGKELFYMSEMMSPETVKIVLTNAKKVNETVAFMNECKAYKVIMKPCRVAADIVEPIEAAVSYKKVREKMLGEQQAYENMAYTVEEDYNRLDRAFRKNQQEFQQVFRLIEMMLHENVNMTVENQECSLKLKNWYTWVLNTYSETLIHANGNYVVCRNNLMNAFHDTEKEQTFIMHRKDKFEILPDKMNQITFLLMLICQTCKLLFAKYQIKVLLEETEKHIIIRMACNYSACVGEDGVLNYLERNQEFRNQLIEATDQFGDMMIHKEVTHTKDNKFIFNFAVRK